MKLVQKLPASLWQLPVLMMMSSCSKEDVQSPAPKVESANYRLQPQSRCCCHAFYMASTKGYMGMLIFSL
jgi:hypothetical protein